MNPDHEPLPAPHFGTDEEMLAWCKSEGIVPRKDGDGNWDWHAAWDEFMKRTDSEEHPQP